VEIGSEYIGPENINSALLPGSALGAGAWSGRRRRHNAPRKILWLNGGCKVMWLKNSAPARCCHRWIGGTRSVAISQRDLVEERQSGE